MAVYSLLTVQANGKEKRLVSNTLAIDFSSVRIGADNLAIIQGGSGGGAYLDLGSRSLRSTFVPANAADYVNKQALDNAIAAVATGAEWQDSVLSVASTPAGGEANGSRLLVEAAGSDDIDSVDQGDKEFTINGVDLTSDIASGDVIKVKASTGNDGWYTVVSSTFSGGNTVIVVDEAIPSAVADGTIYWAGTDLSTIGVDKIAKKVSGTWVLASTPSTGYALLVDDEPTVMYIYGTNDWATRAFESTTASKGVKKVGFDIQRDDAETFENEAGTTVTIRQVCYVKSNGKTTLAQATDVNIDDGMLAIVEDASIANGNTGKFVIRHGAIIEGFSGLTPGMDYFIDKATAGNINLFASISWATGDHVYKAGRAITSTKLLFDPDYRYEF
jgi:hypothetical protein